MTPLLRCAFSLLLRGGIAPVAWQSQFHSALNWRCLATGLDLRWTNTA